MGDAWSRLYQTQTLTSARKQPFHRDPQVNTFMAVVDRIYNRNRGYLVVQLYNNYVYG